MPALDGARNLQAPSDSPETGLYYLGFDNWCMIAGDEGELRSRRRLRGPPDAYAGTLAHVLERTAFPVGRTALPRRS